MYQDNPNPASAAKIFSNEIVHALRYHILADFPMPAISRDDSDAADSYDCQVLP